MVDGAAHNLMADLFGYRNRFTRNHRLIYITMTFNHFTIYRNALTWTDFYNGIGTHFCHRYFNNLTIPMNTRSFGLHAN
ncbi:Uncharacterised protein [Mycobacteroides abscessus subsp. abscessus]|nr:Uncharacterised protein [Mycobacteroides abscessus subsp. abscessus]